MGDENRCIICGRKLRDPLSLYCPECEYELKRTRLADEETVEEWMERVKVDIDEEKHELNGVKPLDFYSQRF